MQTATMLEFGSAPEIGQLAKWTWCTLQKVVEGMLDAVVNVTCAPSHVIGSLLIRRHLWVQVIWFISSSVSSTGSTICERILSTRTHLVSAALSVKNNCAGPSWLIMAQRSFCAFSQNGGEPHKSLRTRNPSSHLTSLSRASGD